MVQQLERSSHTPDGLFTCYPIGDNSHNSTLQDVNKHQGLAYSKPALKCQGGSWFQQSCGHGNWRWAWAPCDKWSCESCHRRRIRQEMVPEIRLALLLAKEKGETLKFLTLTAGDGDPAGDPTAAGAKRRAKNLQRFSQWIRRKWGYFEYLKVAELTKRGRVHTHLVVIMPYINQKALSAFWKLLRSWQATRVIPVTRVTEAHKDSSLALGGNPDSYCKGPWGPLSNCRYDGR